jgi:hypothetical protein
VPYGNRNLLVRSGSGARRFFAVRSSGGDEEPRYLPFADAPINYRSMDLNDPVAKLEKRLERGEVDLHYDPKAGPSISGDGARASVAGGDAKPGACVRHAPN